MKNKLVGFTLVELLIAIAIIAIVSRIAIPSYLDHIKKSRRAEAQGALVSFANAMEVWRLQNNGSYKGGGAGGDTGAPKVFSTVVPISGGKTTYNLTIDAADTSTFTLKATPVATGPQAADGWLKIDNFGTKTCEKATSCLNGTSW